MECPARAIWDMGQGPGACAVDLAPRAKLCAWPEFASSERQKKSLPILASAGPDMADDDILPPPDPPRNPPAEVLLTRADIPELVKAVVEAVEKTAGTPKPPGKWPLIVLVRAISPC